MIDPSQTRPTFGKGQARKVFTTVRNGNADKTFLPAWQIYTGLQLFWEGGEADPGHPVGMNNFRTPCRDVIWDSPLLFLLLLSFSHTLPTPSHIPTTPTPAAPGTPAPTSSHTLPAPAPPAPPTPFPPTPAPPVPSTSPSPALDFPPAPPVPSTPPSPALQFPPAPPSVPASYYPTY